MAKFFPEWEIIKQMNPQPTNGEQYLLDYFKEHLDDSYEVYFQSSLDGGFPDIILIRPNHGVLIIEVKDYNLDIYRIDEPGKTWKCNVTRDNSYLIRSPIAQVKVYKDSFFKVYSRYLNSYSLRNKKIYAAIGTAVFFYNTNEEYLKNFYFEYDKWLHDNYVSVFARDSLFNGTFDEILKKNYLSGRVQSKYFDSTFYNEMVRILRPSEHSKLKYRKMNWDSYQRKFYSSVANRKQKVRGPAGCGKTYVLAHRAIEAYLRTRQPILILTFNITLRHYIHDCISMLRPKDKNIPMRNFMIQHYHRFIKNYENKNGLLPQFRMNKQGNKKERSYVLQAAPQKFSVILVDEAQDYEHEWINNIHNLLEDKGELVFFGDEEQNLYHREQIKEGQKDHRIYTKIGGRWGEMKGSYRLEGKIADLARAFQKAFFSDFDDNEIVPMGQNLFDESSVDYCFVPSAGGGSIAVYDIVKQAILDEKRHFDDICVLSEKIAIIRDVEYLLRKDGYKTITTFESKEDFDYVDKYIAQGKKKKLVDLRRTAKYTFRMETGKLKMSTIHSFKGWGIHTEILIIGDGENHGDFLSRELVYTGITRAQVRLIVINVGDVVYDKFFTSVLPENCIHGHDTEVDVEIPF